MEQNKLGVYSRFFIFYHNTLLTLVSPICRTNFRVSFIPSTLGFVRSEEVSTLGISTCRLEVPGPGGSRRCHRLLHTYRPCGWLWISVFRLGYTISREVRGTFLVRRKEGSDRHRPLEGQYIFPSHRVTKTTETNTESEWWQQKLRRPPTTPLVFLLSLRFEHVSFHE